MAIRFQCPRCNSIRTVHDRMSGKQIRCPDCDSVVRIPASVQGLEIPSVVPLRGGAASELVLDNRYLDPSLQERNMEGQASALGSNKAKQLKAAGVVAPVVKEEEPDTLGFPSPELPKDDMDMTPMVDVTFLLLIFFMITASFSMEKAIQQKAAMSNQASSQPKDEESDTIKILIDEFNAYTVIFPDSDEREATSKQELLAILSMAELDGASEDANTIVVEAHEDSLHATVVGALDAGREKGFSQFQVTVVENFD